MSEINKLEALIETINDKTDVNCTLYESVKDELFIEMEYYSNLGEDCIVSFYCDSTVESFINVLNSINEDYKDRCEEDLELYVSERPRGTEMFSVRELVDDADWKVKFFDDFVKDVNKLYNSKDFKTLVAEATAKQEAERDTSVSDKISRGIDIPEK